MMKSQRAKAININSYKKYPKWLVKDFRKCIIMNSLIGVALIIHYI